MRLAVPAPDADATAEGAVKYFSIEDRSAWYASVPALLEEL